MTENTIVTLAWAVVAIVAIQAWTSYVIVHLFVTGHSLFQRKSEDEPRIVSSERWRP